MRILVVDDQPLFRRGLVAVLEAGGLTVVGAASSVCEAAETASRTQPDLVVADLRLADGSGIDLVRRLAETEGTPPRVVILTESRDPGDMLAAVRAGAAGYLTKDQPPERLAVALNGVLAGEAALSRSMAAHLIDDVRESQRRMLLASKLPHRERLTPRQLEILQQGAVGLASAAAIVLLAVASVFIIIYLRLRSRSEQVAA